MPQCPMSCQLICPLPVHSSKLNNERAGGNDKRAAVVDVLWGFCGVVVDGAIPARRRVQESNGRHAAALIGWCWQSGIGGVARKGAAAETAATTSVPQRCRGGGGARRRSSGGRFFSASIVLSA